MKQSTKEAYAEVDEILNLMDYKYTKLIPKKLRIIIKANKDKNHNKKILFDKPLSEQGLKDETLSILAALNYNYWCKDEKKKKELIDLYSKNEKSNKEETNELDNLNNTIKNINEETKQEMLGLIIYKEPKWYQKILKKFVNIFRRKNIK